MSDSDRLTGSRPSANGAALLIAVICTIILIAAAVPLAGGYGRREVEDTAFVLALGFDRNPDGLYQVTSQVAVPAKAKDGDSGALPVIVVTNSGNTVAEALLEFSHASNKEPFWGQVRLAVFGESLAREGILPILDFLSRGHEARITMWTLATPGRAEDVLTKASETENLPAMFLSGLIDETSFHSTAPSTTLFQTVLAVDSVTGDAFLPRLVRATAGVEVKAGGSSGEESKQGAAGAANPLTLDGAAVFQDDRLVGWLSPSDSRGVLWLRGGVKRTTISFKDPAQGLAGAVHVYRARRQVAVSVDQANPANSKFAFTIRADANLMEYLSGPDLGQPSTRSAIETVVAQQIQAETVAALQRLQEFKSDAIGLGELMREKLSNAAWEEVRKHWFDAYPSVAVDVKVDLRLRLPGLILGRMGLGRPEAGK